MRRSRPLSASLNLSPWALRLALVLCALIVSVNPCLGQERDDAAKRNSLQPGAWALQFRINENFTLGNFSGTGIAIKRHFSSGSALRAGVSLGFERGDTLASQDTLAVRTDRNGQAIEVQLQYLWYPEPTSAINFFVGGGPLFGYTHAKETRVYLQDQSVRKTYGRSVGISGTLGVEWFPAEVMGLHAEYGFAVRYSSADNTDTQTSPSRTSEAGLWRFSFDSVLFGVSAYF